MITQIDVTSSSGSILTLSATDYTSGIALINVEGIDPVKATITSSSFAKIDGTQYQSARREARNIIIKLSLEPNYVTNTVRSLRNIVYSFFMPKSEVSLKFHVDTDLDVNIVGRVETCTMDYFNKDTEMVISIICFDPDFIDSETETISGSSVNNETVIPFTYDGSVESGIKFTISINRTLSAFTIYHIPPDGTIRTLDFAMPMYSGDVVEISTVKGDKYVYNTRAGIRYSVLYGMSPQSNWIEFEHGANTFRVYAEGAALSYTVTYQNRYGGL